MKKFINYYIMEIVGVFYIAFALSLFFYVDSFTSQERFDVLYNLRKYLVLEFGGYLADKKFYSVLLNNALLLFTSVFIFVLYPFHKGRKFPKRRKPYGFFHLMYSIFGISISLYFIISDWGVFSGFTREVRWNLLTYIIFNCSVYVLFISECWYFVDAVRWVWKFFRYILNPQKTDVLVVRDEPVNFQRKREKYSFWNPHPYVMYLLALYVIIRLFIF